MLKYLKFETGEENQNVVYNCGVSCGGSFKYEIKCF